MLKKENVNSDKNMEKKGTNRHMKINRKSAEINF